MDPTMAVTSAFKVSDSEYKLIEELDTRVTAIEAGGGGGAVDSVNAQTGTVVLDADDIDDTSTTNKFATAAQLSAVDGLAATYQPLDADLTALASAGNSATLAATTASFTTADETKLDGIEALADVTDAANVSTAGGLIVVAYNAGWPARPSVSGPVMWVNDTNATAPTADVAGDIVLLNEA